MLKEHDLAPEQPGKGRNVWYCFGYTLASGRAKAVALHDCDITTYKREMLARLIYPVANPHFGYKFCKGYYARVADNKLNGRVCRLLVNSGTRQVVVTDTIMFLLFTFVAFLALYYIIDAAGGWFQTVRDAVH